MEYLIFVFFHKRYLKKHATSVRVPVNLNILGQEFFTESSILTHQYIYIKVYEEDFELIPDIESKILLFMNLNFYTRGQLELTGSLVHKEFLPGARQGLWIKFLDISKEDETFITDFTTKYYFPRYSTKFNVIVYTQSSKMFLTEAVNISENGIFLETGDTSLNVGSRCELSLEFSNVSLLIQSVVSWVNQGKIYNKPNGYGMKFLHNKTTANLVKKYIEGLKNKSALLR